MASGRNRHRHGNDGRTRPGPKNPTTQRGVVHAATSVPAYVPRILAVLIPQASFRQQARLQAAPRRREEHGVRTQITGRDAAAFHPHRRSLARLAPRVDRVCRGPCLGARARADQCLAGPVPDVSGAGLADRRRRRSLGRRVARRRHRLVVRFRLPARGTLLAGLRVPGRCADLRLDVAVRRGPRAGRIGCLPGSGHCAGKTPLDAWRAADPGARGWADRHRMAARARAHRISLERIRLCADDAAWRWRRAPRWSASGG